MVENMNSCPAEDASRQFSCAGIELPEDFILEKQIFLISLLPCCVNLALPYWGKIIGTITNTCSEEKTLEISARLIDCHENQVTAYSDLVALEPGNTGEFDIKIIEHDERAISYRLVVTEVQELQ